MNKGDKRNDQQNPRTSASVLVLVASGTSKTSSFGAQRTEMYWYNPKSRTSERVAAPISDMQAICMACTHPVLCRVHKVLLRATPLGDADRASFGVSGT